MLRPYGNDQERGESGDEKDETKLCPVTHCCPELRKRPRTGRVGRRKGRVKTVSGDALLPRPTGTTKKGESRETKRTNQNRVR